ncbi:hypothetical protein BC833DRAFT_323998 [Globomyces pollinis-pini]|nr:hypothetical protein BC833DRAFT_323998 [Globomyces pollinis-pini]
MKISVSYAIYLTNLFALTAGQAKAKAAAPADKSDLPNGLRALNPIRANGFCEGIINGNVKPADGTQFKTGGVTCSSLPLGLIPTTNRMVSTIITQPGDGETIDASVENIIQLDNANLVTGFFSDANVEYYLAPQTFDNGVIQGHQHVTVQKLQGTQVLDPKVFAFFKGINDAATDAQGRQLQAVVPPGSIKENGEYRICSITGAATHQPVLSPIQNRGPQDDCIRITVTGAGGQGKNIQVADDNAESKKVTAKGKQTGRDAAKGAQAKGNNPNNGKNAAKAAGKNAGKNAAKDAGKNAAKDAGKNAAKDAGKNAAKDAGKNAAKDAGKNAAKDAGKNGGKNAAKDAGKNAAKDNAAKDAGKNAAKDAGKNAGKDAGKNAKAKNNNNLQRRKAKRSIRR